MVSWWRIPVFVTFNGVVVQVDVPWFCCKLQPKKVILTWPEHWGRVDRQCRTLTFCEAYWKPGYGQFWGSQLVLSSALGRLRQFFLLEDIYVLQCGIWIFADGTGVALILHPRKLTWNLKYPLRKGTTFTNRYFFLRFFVSSMLVFGGVIGVPCRFEDWTLSNKGVFIFVSDEAAKTTDSTASP